VIPEQIIYQGAAIVGASALIGGYVEARRTRQAVEKHDRALYGTDHRKGLVEVVNEMRGKARKRSKKDA